MRALPATVRLRRTWAPPRRPVATEGGPDRIESTVPQGTSSAGGAHLPAVGRAREARTRTGGLFARDPDRAIVAMSQEVLATRSLPERAQLLRTLVSVTDGKLRRAGAHLFGPGAITKDWRAWPAEKAKQEAMVRILESAKDAAELDHLSSRVGPALLRALSGSRARRAKALIEASRRSAIRGEWRELFRYLEVVAGVTGSGRNQLDLLIGGKEAIAAATADLAQPWSSIFGTVFQLEPDAIGGAFADRLIAQAQSGAGVHFALDEMGTEGQDEAAAHALYGRLRAGGVDLLVNESPLTLSHLNHRKVMVLVNPDGNAAGGAVAYTGGMNVGVHYQGTPEQGGWHDQTTRVRGPAVKAMFEALVQHWERDGGAPLSALELAGVRSALEQVGEVASGSPTWVVPHEGNGFDRNIKYGYLRAIRTAKESIRIANPYWGDPDVMRALEDAARAGVEVKLFFPAENDQKLLEVLASSYYERLLAAGVEVFEVPGMVHLKVAEFDQEVVTLGSSNLDARSLEFNDELNLFVWDPAFAKEVRERLFEVDEARARRVVEHDRTLFERWVRLARPFA